MRKRRNLIVALILVATMVVGIGYAAISTTLTINGAAKSAISNEDPTLDILFTDADVVSAVLSQVGSATNDTSDGSAVATARVDDSDKLIAYYDIGTDPAHTKKLTREGDKVTFTYTIENRSTDVAAQLGSIDLSVPGTLTGDDSASLNASEYFSRKVTVTYDGQDYVESDLDGEDSKTNVISIAPGEEATVTVVVTLTKTLGVNNDTSISLAGAKILFNFSGVNPNP